MTEELEAVVAVQVARLRRLATDTATVEVKAAVGKLPKELGETLSAFSNGSGGVVILGLSEADRFIPAPGFQAGPRRARWTLQ